MFVHERVKKYAQVCVSLLYGGVCNRAPPRVTRVLSRFLHSVPSNLSLQARAAEKVREGKREEEKVKKRWEITLNSGSRSANVQKSNCINTHRCEHTKNRVTLKPEATRRILILF